MWKLILVAVAIVLLAIVVRRVIEGVGARKRPPRRLRDREQDIDDADFTDLGSPDE